MEAMNQTLVEDISPDDSMKIHDSVREAMGLETTEDRLKREAEAKRKARLELLAAIAPHLPNIGSFIIMKIKNRNMVKITRIGQEKHSIEIVPISLLNPSAQKPPAK